MEYSSPESIIGQLHRAAAVCSGGCLAVYGQHGTTFLQAGQPDNIERLNTLMESGTHWPLAFVVFVQEGTKLDCVVSPLKEVRHLPHLDAYLHAIASHFQGLLEAAGKVRGPLLM